MNTNILHQILTYCIAAVWFANGLLCKVLGWVPRHQQIVGRILGNEHSKTLIILIGWAEILMAIWVLSKFKSKLNAIIQVIIVASMNIIEFILAPDLLLWGKLNLLFALVFIGMVYYNEYALNKKQFRKI